MDSMTQMDVPGETFHYLGVERRFISGWTWQGKELDRGGRAAAGQARPVARR